MMRWQWGLVAPNYAQGEDSAQTPHNHVLGPTAAVGQRWPGELVRHSRLNSEHFPRPTHDIRNIIRQCQPAPRGSQPPRYPPQPSSRAAGFSCL